MDGIVNVLKPPGMTSSDVVTDIRRIFHIKRVGHTGTLDPGAAGVLPVCIGRATRLFDVLVDKDKEYIAEITFGACTDTQDSYGTVLERSSDEVSRQALLEALPHFLGVQQQIAPAYSALKHEGKALYEIARQGGDVPQRVREVKIHGIHLLDQTAKNKYLLRVQCTRGTYIRTLCEDIGRHIHACAHLSFLLRSASGEFRIENTYSIQQLKEMQEASRLCEAVIPVEEAVGFLPEIHLTEGVGRLLNGITIPLQNSGGFWSPEQPLCRVYEEHRFLGIGMLMENSLKMHIQYISG